ncbi:cathepsin B [Tribolium castaneum]|uniref:Cathepsin B n=1 Tax=Tribolium castaneum TaxID=7070 RepID=D6WGZ2_TRICA|nr:PREDICTED: cathepsin B [Tribolium castaneum]EFA01288.1 cathepsin B precursor [Tribolium castaneum]|eukprot:XP_974244.1 PREDICTED: cathepsin B [Tribolium castaneum]
MYFLIFLLLASISVSRAEIDIQSQDFIDSINQKQSHWVARRNFPENTTNEYLYKLNGFLGLHPDPNYMPEKIKHNFNPQDIPKTFDARKKWPKCDSLNRIRDQGSCGSCWAFAAVETMSDRICIHSSGAKKFFFSAEDLLSCCTACGSCSGGYMMAAFDFYIKQGVVSGGDLNSNEGCRPYTADAHDKGVTPSCTKSCRKGYPTSYSSDKHYGSKDYIVDAGVSNIQYEIMTNGPIIVSFKVYQDFYNYGSGVYHHVSGNYTGNHIVKIVGWGTEKEQDYWLIANSWGSSWGEHGFFKILRGKNECGIENNPYAVLPKL